MAGAESSNHSGPLSGFRIIDISTVMAAPFATGLLADHGADVIKVEPPELDIMRRSGAAPDPDNSPIFEHMNRNKRGIVLDLKDPAGHDAFLRLLEDADAIVSNMRTAALKRLGLDYATLNPRFPRLVHLSVVGYGAGGRYERKPAYDDLVQGAAAIPSLVSRASGAEPRFVPFAVSDRSTGLYAANALLMALLKRERTGVAEEVQVALFEATTHFLLVEHMFGASFEPGFGSAVNKRMMERDRRPFETADGYVCALPYSNRHWQELFRILAVPEYAEDARFADFQGRRENISILYALLAERLVERTTAEWLVEFDAADIPATGVPTIDELLADPHLDDRDFFQWTSPPGRETFRHMRSPLDWSGWEAPSPRPSPRPSEHAEEVLREAGFGAEEIEALFAGGASRRGSATAPDPTAGRA